MLGRRLFSYRIKKEKEVEVDPYMTIRTVGDMKKVMSLFEDEQPLTFFANVHLRRGMPDAIILPRSVKPKADVCGFRVYYPHKNNRAVEIMPIENDLKSIEV